MSSTFRRYRPASCMDNEHIQKSVFLLTPILLLQESNKRSRNKCNAVSSICLQRTHLSIIALEICTFSLKDALCWSVLHRIKFYKPYLNLITRKSFLLSMMTPSAWSLRALRAAFHNRYFSRRGRSGRMMGSVKGV